MAAVCNINRLAVDAGADFGKGHGRGRRALRSGVDNHTNNMSF